MASRASGKPLRPNQGRRFSCESARPRSPERAPSPPPRRLRILRDVCCGASWPFFFSSHLTMGNLVALATVPLRRLYSIKTSKTTRQHESFCFREFGTELRPIKKISIVPSPGKAFLELRNSFLAINRILFPDPMLIFFDFHKNEYRDLFLKPTVHCVAAAAERFLTQQIHSSRPCLRSWKQASMRPPPHLFQVT